MVKEKHNKAHEANSGNQEQPEVQSNDVHKNAAPIGTAGIADSKTEQQTREKDLTEQLQRLQAEFENYRKRVDGEALQAASRAEEKMLKELLVVADSLELAVKHSAKTTDDAAVAAELRTALQLIHNQLSHFLEQQKVEKIPATGMVDPRLHEVYTTETHSSPAGTVLETFQHGYRRHGTVLRTAKVKAARNE